MVPVLLQVGDPGACNVTFSISMLSRGGSEKNAAPFLCEWTVSLAASGNGAMDRGQEFISAGTLLYEERRCDGGWQQLAPI